MVRAIQNDPSDGRCSAACDAVEGSEVGADKDMRELRFEFGVRYWFVDQWKGYVAVDKHLKATTHMVD
jgi:hypothetical protein